MKATWIGCSTLWALASLMTGCSSGPEASHGEVSSASTPREVQLIAQEGDTSAEPQLTEAAKLFFVSKTSDGYHYAIDELNTATGTQYVGAIDLGRAGCNSESLEAALDTPRTVAALGTIRGETFVALAVYRALPDLAATAADSYFQARPVRGGDVATEVNLGQQTEIARVDFSKARVPFLDQTWLSARVLEGGALVSGSVSQESAALVATTIYLPVLDGAKCAPAGGTCGEGSVATYTRDSSRCLAFNGCTTIGVCPLYIPLCDPGYKLAVWPATHGCPAWACDPAFDPAPESR